MTALDFADVRTSAQYAIEVNEGFSACLSGKRLEDCPYFPQESAPAQAWSQGWRSAAKATKIKFR